MAERAFQSIAGFRINKTNNTNEENHEISNDNTNDTHQGRASSKIDPELVTSSETDNKEESISPLRAQFMELEKKLSEEEDDDEHTPAEHVRNTKPWKIHVLIVKCPCLCCCFFLLWFIICGIIVVTAPGLLAFTTEVPFYIRDNLPTTLQDSLNAGKADASWERQTSDTIQKQQQVAADVNLQLIYKSLDGTSLMKKEYLELMDYIESKVQATNGYIDHCRRLYSGLMVNDTDDNSYKCSRETSVTNFFDKRYFKPSIDNGYTLEPSLTNTQIYFLQSSFIDGTLDIMNKNYSQQFVDTILSYWAGYGQGHGPSGQYVRKYYNGKEMPATFNYQRFVNNELTNFSMANIFGSIVGKDFAYNTPLDTDVSVAMTIFSFGLPLSGYSSSSDDTDDQQSEIGEWCFNELHDLFTQFAEDNEDSFEFYWGCADMNTYYTQSLMLQDAFFMIATFVSVYLLMIFNTGSVWLASCGMLMIFMNFLPSILLYRFITQLEYFGTLCMMAMFIILSIGADDVFVIVDTWAQYRTAAPDEGVDKRLTATLKHAGKVMATTSLSTCFSFIGNTTSVFPGVYTFGAFSAWLVFVNYCSVVLFYPTVLAVHDKYFYTSNLKRGYCCTRTCGKNNKKCCFMNNEKTEYDDSLDEEDRKRPIDKFFEHTFFPAVYKRKKNILAISFIFFLAFFYLAVQIEADPEVPQMFPAGNNYQEFRGQLSENFASQTVYKVSPQIVWGIDGIDRTGTDYTIPDDIGQVIYSKNVSFYSPEEQQYLAQFCDDLLCVYSDYDCRYPKSTYYNLKIADPADYGGERINVVKCFMTEFREWVLTDSTSRPNISDIEELLIDYDLTDTFSVSDFEHCEFGVFPVAGRKCFALLFAYLWLNDDLPTSNPDYVAGTDNYDYWKDQVWIKQTGNEENVDYGTYAGINLKFFMVNVLAEATISEPYNDGIQLFKDWQTFGENWRDNVDGQSSVDKNGDEYIDTPSTLKSIMITDRAIFAYYYQQKQIIKEALLGIGLSLLFAFIILTLATGNWIMAIYSCFVIFSIVVCVMGFSTLNGWKLGIIEAIIYVMVVGLSVDYVVHLSEAYLASGKYHRIDRSRRMLGIVGGSVLSGAISTLIGILWLFLATVVVFFKFGSFIFFLIAVSLTFSLVSFTAAMSSFGPQGSTGNVTLCIKRCFKCLRKDKSVSSQQKSVDHIEMR